MRDLGRCLAVACRAPVDLDSAQHAQPPEPCKDPQVIAVSPSALSGFRLRPPAGAIQEDSLKPSVFALVSATAGALEPRSASFPGIEVRRCQAVCA